MARASFYDLYEGLRDFVRRFTSYSASTDVVVSPGRRSFVEQDEQAGTDARRGAPSASLRSSQSVTAGSRTLSPTSRPSPIVRSPTPHTPNQPVSRIPQPPQAPRAPPRAPRTTRILMPPLAPLNLDASIPTNRRSGTSGRPNLRNLPPLDSAYEYAKREGAGPLQRPHAARPSPMGLTRTGTLIIGDPDYTGPLHEMQSVHAVGRRHAPRGNGEGNVLSGREHRRTPPIVSTSSAPAGIAPRSNARNRRRLRANQSMSAQQAFPRARQAHLAVGRRRDPSTESQWSSTAVARGGISSPSHMTPESAMWDAGDNAERKKRRTDTDHASQAEQSSTSSTEAVHGGASRQGSWGWDPSVDELVQTWSTVATDGRFGSRRGSDRDCDDLGASISPPPSEFGSTYGSSLDVGAGVLGSPFTSGSAGSSSRKRSREVEEPRANRAESDFRGRDSELRSSPASTIYGLGQSSRISSRDRPGRTRTRRGRCHSNPENSVRQKRSRGDGPPRKRHRSY